jgi:uncharacterized phage protein gp47/JayE
MRTIDEIYSEMAADYESESGLILHDGGDMSLRLHAVAAQVCALENQLEFTRRQAFPQTAEGEYLDRHAAVRALRRGGAVCAEGTVRFFVDEAADSDIPVAAGVVCVDSAGTQFVTAESGVIPAGALWCELKCTAAEAGEAGNVPAGAISAMPLPPVGVAGCVNTAAFTGGSAGESDESLRSRVLASYSSLPNGANIAYYESQALSVDGVYAVQVLPRARGLGTVDVYVAAESGLPAADTVEQVREKLAAQREICVDIAVAAPTARPVNLTVALAAANQAAAQASARAAIEAYFSGALLGKGVLLAEVSSRVFAAEGVENCRITVPAADVAAEDGVLPVLGTLSFTALGA